MEVAFHVKEPLMLLSHASKGIEIAGRRESLQKAINGSGQSEIDIAERQSRGLLD
jgi:hypothetical protein